MKDVILHLNDKAKAVDFSNLSGKDQELLTEKLNAGVKKTKIIFRNHDTGEILREVENKVLIPGSQLNACRAFGLDPVVAFKSYNQEMGLDNSVDPSEPPKNDQIVCLFCIADAGCGTLPKDVYKTKVTDRIAPAPADPSSPEEFNSKMIMPFRYVDFDKDLDENLRQFYFGRKTFTNLGKIGYYFKKFDTDPQLHLRYADGTQITQDIYNSESDQEAECYIQMRMRITRLDFRDYFENAIGWDNGRISSLSLCTAWYDDTIDQYRYYQNIIPYSLLNFSFQLLVSSELALDLEYIVYY